MGAVNEPNVWASRMAEPDGQGHRFRLSFPIVEMFILSEPQRIVLYLDCEQTRELSKSLADTLGTASFDERQPTTNECAEQEQIKNLTAQLARAYKDLGNLWVILDGMRHKVDRKAEAYLDGGREE